MLYVNNLRFGRKLISHRQVKLLFFALGFATMLFKLAGAVAVFYVYVDKSFNRIGNTFHVIATEITRFFLHIIFMIFFTVAYLYAHS